MAIIKRIGSCSKDCYGGCVFEGEWDDNAIEHKLLNAIPIQGHPFTQGVFCSKLQRRQDAIYHPNRLKQPLKRKGKKGSNVFEPISIDAALSQISEKIKSTIASYGSNSILGAFYSGNSYLISQLSPMRFFNAIGGTVTTGGICNEGGNAGLKQIFGTYSTTNPFQLADLNTKLIVIWSSNLTDTNNHAYLLIKKALRNGAFLIVIDSRRTQIAKEAHYFLPILPGTEHLVAILLIKYLIQCNALDTAFIDAHVEDFSRIEQEINHINEDDLYRKLDLTHHSIEEFGDLLIQFNHHTIFSVGIGAQKDYYGGKIIQNIALVQILLGNIGLPGTGIIFSQSDFNHRFVEPLVNYITKDNPEHPIPTFPIIELGSQLNSGIYKMIFIWNFNPSNSLPNQKIVREAFARDDLFCVVIDLFENETTRYADLVIPGKFDVETDDLLTPYYIPGISLNEGGPCPYPDCISNWEFFQLLAQKLGLAQPRFQESQTEISKFCLKLLPLQMQSDLSSKGYSLLFKPVEVLYKNLHFPTHSSKIQLNPIQLTFGLDELEKRLTRKANEYLLITPSHPQLLHSQLGQIHPETQSVADKIFISPKDLHSSGLEVGQLVSVYNENHSAEYFISVSTQLKPGVVMIYKGVHTVDHNTRNANFFTSDRPEELGKSGSYNAAVISIKSKINNS